MYGTGRIHCHSTLSVNYHRAINRVETEPHCLYVRVHICFNRKPAVKFPIFFAHFGTSTFLLCFSLFEQSCVVPIWDKTDSQLFSWRFFSYLCVRETRREERGWAMDLIDCAVPLRYHWLPWRLYLWDAVPCNLNPARHTDLVALSHSVWQW